MKNIIIIAVALFAFTACGNNDKNHNDSTHVHEDGTIHQNHDTENVETKQENFKVETEKPQLFPIKSNCL